MRSFDPNKLSYEIVQLKSCTTALGGSVSVVDEEATNKNGNTKDVYKRIEVPYNVARRFKKIHYTTTYIKPVQAALVYYDGHAISVERHPFSSDEQWTPNSQLNVNKIKRRLTGSDWLFDGRFAYRFEPSLQEQADKAKWLSRDGQFRLVSVTTIDMNALDRSERSLFGDDEDDGREIRQCVVFMVNGKPYATPPIWKDNAIHVRPKYVKGDDGHNYEDPNHYPMDELDSMYAVNVNFALKAGKDISEHFGYESIEPLQIPELMHRLNTVNLPKVDTSVKRTFDIGLKPTQAFTWVLGKMYGAEDLQTMVDMRGLLKHLMTRGIFHRNILAEANVFEEGANAHNVPLKTRSQIEQEIER